MSIKRKIKTLYKNSLLRLGKSKVGDTVSVFLVGSASIIQEETGHGKRELLSERLMVKRLIEAGEGSVENKLTEVDKVVETQIQSGSWKSGVHTDIARDMNRIKVRIAHCNPATFNAIETIAEAFQEDKYYEVKVILMQESGNSFEMSRQMKEKGFDFIFDSDYDVKKDHPDIIIFYQLEYMYTEALYEAYKYSGMVVLVPLTLTTIWYGERSVSRMHLDKFRPKLVFSTDLVMDKICAKVSEVRILKMVPPQIDTVFRRINGEKRYPMGWEKLKGKRVMFYMTDHGLQHYSVSNEVSFDLYVRLLFEYASRPENMDVGIIIRPHFALIQELMAHFWSVKDYLSLVDFCNRSANIVWDETNDFMNGLSICDAVLSDLNTSVTYFSLAAGKPVAATLRYDMPVEIYNEELLDGIYAIRSQDNLTKFMNMVKAGKDPKKQKRDVLFGRLIAPFDGQNGRRIKEAIEQEYRKVHNTVEDSTY